MPEKPKDEHINNIDKQSAAYFRLLTDSLPNVAVGILGSTYELKRYLTVVSDLANLIGAGRNKDEILTATKEHHSQLGYESNYRSSHMESYDNLRAFLIENNINIIDLLFGLTKLDIRISLCLFYIFGFFPQYKTKIEFFRAFGLHNSFLNFYITEGVKELIEFLQQSENLNIGMNNKYQDVRTFLIDLLTLDPNQLGKYPDDSLVPYESVIYTFFKFVSKNADINREMLSDLQIQLWEYYSLYYIRYKRVPKNELVMETFYISLSALKRNVGNILELQENSSDNKYVKGISGLVRERSEGTLSEQLLALYKSDPNIINYPNLTELQKKCIQAVINNVSEDQVTVSALAVVGQVVGLSSHSMHQQIAFAINKIEDKTGYYDKSGFKLQNNDIRVQVIDSKILSEVVEHKVRPVNVRIMCLISELQPNSRTFKYTIDEVIAMVGVKTKSPERSIYNMCKHVLRGKDDFNLTLVDQNNEALTKNHLKVVELLLKHGIPNKIKKDKTLNSVAQWLLQIDSDGRYYSYEYIGKQIAYSEPRVVDFMMQILEALENLES